MVSNISHQMCLVMFARSTTSLACKEAKVAILDFKEMRRFEVLGMMIMNLPNTVRIKLHIDHHSVCCRSHRR